LAFPGVSAWIDRTISDARELGYVKTMMNRIRYVPDINSDNRSRREFAERTAINTPIQGTAADLIKLAMIRVADSLSTDKAKLILQIHDELVLEVLEDELETTTEIVRKEMASTLPLHVPVVVEVGVDVPNATIMVIEGADRFGLAQLHQLRGRIGRSEAKSYCFLFAETENETAKNRLEIMTRSNDGFEIAEQDLQLRGPGEMFSTRQHGLPDLKIANIIDDYELLVMARKEAFEIVSQDPMLLRPEHNNIRRALISKFGDSLGLADVA